MDRGHEALAICVHRENPIEAISLKQLAQVYGREGHVRRWSELGVNLPAGVSDEIILISRQSNSGTLEHFRRAILGGRGDLRLVRAT